MSYSTGAVTISSKIIDTDPRGVELLHILHWSLAVDIALRQHLKLSMKLLDVSIWSADVTMGLVRECQKLTICRQR